LKSRPLNSEAPLKPLGDAKAMRSQLANCQRSQKRWKQTAQAARTEILEKYAWLSITQAVLKAGQSDYLAAEAEVASLRQQLEAALRKGADLALPVSPAPKPWYHSCRRQTRASIVAKSRSMRGHHNEYTATFFSSYTAL
jgi:hypothetical protein